MGWWGKSLRAATGAVLIVGTVAIAAPAAQAGPGGGGYVSIGDSLAFGYQPNLVAAHDFNPADYASYAEIYAHDEHLSLANFGCPGETTTTLIGGGCPWILGGLPTHVPFGGQPQLTSALAYLGAHPDTKLITIDIGSNDLLSVVDGCLTAPSILACVQAGLPGALSTLIGNYAVVLGSLHAVAPSAKIVIFNIYNPLALQVPGSDAISTLVNGQLLTLAHYFGASVADAFRAINGKLGSPREAHYICTRTWECTPYQNIHPTTLGYQELAIALERAVER